MKKKPTDKAKNAAAAPKAAPAKKTAVKEAVHPEGTLIEFVGYVDANPKGKLELGEKLSLGQYWTENKMYDVHRLKKGKPVAKAIDTLAEAEFTFLPEGEGGDELTVNDGETTEDKPGKAAKAAPAKVKKEAAPAAPAKSKAQLKEEAKAAKEAAAALEAAEAGPVKVVSSVKEAIKTAGNDPIAAARNLFDKVESDYFVLGGVLAKIQEDDSHTSILDDKDSPVFAAGQKGFAAFVEKYLGMKYRKAQYLSQTYRTITALEIPESRITNIGWSKLKEALSYLRQGGNVDETLKLAKELPINEFKSAIRKRSVDEGKKQHGNTGNSHEMTGFSFQVHNDQGELFNQALHRAAEALGVTPPSEDPSTLGQCFTHIVSEWVTFSTPEA